MLTEFEALFLATLQPALGGRRILICAVCSEWLESGGQAPVFTGRDNAYWSRRVHQVLGPETDFVRVVQPQRPVMLHSRCATCARLGPANLYPAILEGAAE